MVSPDDSALPLTATPFLPDAQPDRPAASSGGGRRWLRVSTSRPCPVCGKPDWCGVAADGSAAACMRVELGSIRRLKNGAWLHRFDDDDPHRPNGGCLPMPDEVPDDEPSPAQVALKLGRLMDHYRRAITPPQADRLAAQLGLSSRRPLEDLGVGWSDFHPGYAFPARNHTGKLVGIQVRHADGSKRLIRGSRQGLFLPWNLRQQPVNTPLVICEGASDTAACLDLAYRHQQAHGLPALPWRAVGRPNWACGGEELLMLVLFLHPDADARVVVMADSEPSGDGRRGARDLAALLRAFVRRVHVLVPAGKAKDLRDRLSNGLDTGRFAAVIGAVRS